ncbi:MAG: beta-N-acetylhexosaminidase [Chloroflexota bacterium]|nr:beta-N-acetylhexosaminidase [Chloroflexota bacterium]
MNGERLFHRRALLKAAALGSGSLALAACGMPPGTGAPATSAPTTTEGAGSQSPPSATPTPTATPAPTLAPLRQRIARLLVVGFRGLTVSPDDPIARAIADDGLGGVILFDRDEVVGVRNVASQDQLATLIDSLRAFAPSRELIVAIDQEGGKVTRLSPKYGFPSVASEEAIGGAGDTKVQAWAEGIAGTLAGVGINLNFAPVVDLNVNPTNPAIGALDRAFSGDPAVVSRDAEIETTAHRERDIKTALKHFPGLGSATANTDFGVADVTKTWRDEELDPYRDLLGLGLVDVIMAAHVVNGQFDASAPASLSHKTVTGLLRGTLGWDGVVVTDDMGAAAIRQAFGLNDAVGLALNAGNDLLLFANQHDYDAKLATKVIDLIDGLVSDGTVAEHRIDEAVARVSSLFDAPGADPG